MPCDRGQAGREVRGAGHDLVAVAGQDARHGLAEHLVVVADHDPGHAVPAGRRPKPGPAPVVDELPGLLPAAFRARGISWEAHDIPAEPFDPTISSIPTLSYHVISVKSRLWCFDTPTDPYPRHGAEKRSTGRRCLSLIHI